MYGFRDESIIDPKPRTIALMRLGFFSATDPTLVAALVVAAIAPRAFAVANIFTEDFATSAAGWANFNSGNFLTYNATGGPDGSSYASGPRSFLNQAAGNTPVALRARWDDPWNSSNDAFHRNWVTDGVRLVSAWFKHDVPVPVGFFLRVAGEANTPGHVYVDGIGSDSNTWKLAQPNTWTRFVFNVSDLSPNLRSSENGTWPSVLSLVGHVQFGAIVPAGFSTDATSYTLGIDKVTISTPEPASIALVAFGLVGFALLSSRRRVRNQRLDT
jgi:PEP-CTERM motif